MMSTRSFTVSQGELEKRGKLLKKNTQISRFVDLNTDLGQTRDLAFWDSLEGDRVLSAVSSVNLPCFVHDGLPDKVLALAVKAKAFGCALGAHIAYPDPVSMGYERLSLNPESLKVEHVRPHGALYQAMREDPEIASVVASTVAKFDVWLPVIAPYGDYLTQLEQNYNSVVAPEVILGKRYSANGKEASKQFQDWLSLSSSLEQGRLLISDSALVAQNGTRMDCRFKTLHISPTLPYAVDLAEGLAETLGQAIPLNVASAGESGWLLEYDNRQDVVPHSPYEDY
jgi:UPF0271 protein